jgi:transposase-like protein
MKRTKVIEGRRCPNCGDEENQANFGYNRSGTQRCRCKLCKKTYTLEPKTRAYSEEVRDSAMKTFYTGGSGRQIGILYGMSKGNVYNWIKKNGSGMGE